MTKTSLRVGGVPEHFNYPWHLALQRDAFAQAGLDLQWQDYSTGTGAMVKDLAASELDLAVLLSEGAVAAISGGADLRILGWTVNSPLVWGVHVAPSITASRLDQMTDPRIAISRYGSGSHLMAFVLMQQQGLAQRWQNHQFVVVDNLPGAALAFAKDRADLFMWEQFTTQPSVDQGLMRRLATCPTPWPPFCLVAPTALLENDPDSVNQLQQIYYQSAQQADQLPDLIERLSEFYQLRPQQVSQWREITRWAMDTQIEPAQVDQIIQQLSALGLARSDLRPEHCLAP